MKYDRIKELREDRDLSQQALADYLQITRSSYSNYENHIRSIPNEVLCSLANYYHTSVDYLLERTDTIIPYPPKGD